MSGLEYQDYSLSVFKKHVRGQKSIRIFTLDSTPETTQAESQRWLKSDQPGTRSELAQAITGKTVNVFERVDSI